MINLLIRWAVNAGALWVVAFLVPGVSWNGGVLELFIAAAVLGLLNAIVRPILVVLTLPVTILTLGLFLIVINAAMLWLLSILMSDFVVTGCLPAVIGAVVLSIVGFLTSWIGRESKSK